MKIKLIQYLQLFRTIPAGDQRQILTAFDEGLYKPGVPIIEPGNVVNNIYFIVNGMVKIFVPKGKKTITCYFLGEQQLMNLIHCFDEDTESEQGYQAVCETEILSISKEKLLVLFKQIPYLKDIFHQISLLSLTRMISEKNKYLGSDSTEKYRLLLELQSEIALKAPLTDIASYLGITPQSLSRIRRMIR